MTSVSAAFSAPTTNEPRTAYVSGLIAEWLALARPEHIVF